MRMRLVEQDATPSVPSDIPRGTHAARPASGGDVAFGLAAVGLTIVAALVRQIWTPGFYYADDTQLGSVGMWWELGERLLRGELPVLNTHTWQAGNVWAEGQWGLINPLSWLIALGAHVVGDIGLWAAVVKVAFLALMSGGVYLLARDFRAQPIWAAAAGVLVPLGGFTAYMDAPSWATGLMTTALFPWVWWTVRRVQRGSSPVPFLISSYILITIGYVFGTLLLALLLVMELTLAAWARNRRDLLVLAAASSWSALWTIVVYLPGVLTASFTKRNSLGIANYFFLNADLGDLSSLSTPVASATIGSWNGPVTAAPLVYIAWALPLVVLARPWTRRMWRGTASLWIVAAVVAAVVVGPSDVGPIRWPVRFMPYLVLVTVILFAVAMSRGYPARVTRRSASTTSAVFVALSGLTWALTPAGWRGIGACLVVQLVATWAMWYVAVLLRRSPGQRPRHLRSARRIAAGATAMLAVITVLFLALQLRVFPRTPLPVFAAPTQASAMTGVLADAEGDVTTVGDAWGGSEDPRSFALRLIANQWYFSSADVANTYTVLPVRTYSDDLCMDLRGSTCDTALGTLLSIDETTGARVADLLGISTILGYRQTFPDPPTDVPDGWYVSDVDERTWRVVRDDGAPGAGEVTWTGSGTRVTTVAAADDSVTFRVDAVGADGRVVLARLAWPGYGVKGAVFADPTRGYLLTVDVSAVSPGELVTVTFRPPGTPVMISAAAAAGLLGAGWVIVRLTRRRQTRRLTVTAADPDAPITPLDEREDELTPTRTGAGG